MRPTTLTLDSPEIRELLEGAPAYSRRGAPRRRVLRLVLELSRMELSRMELSRMELSRMDLDRMHASVGGVPSGVARDVLSRLEPGSDAHRVWRAELDRYGITYVLEGRPGKTAAGSRKWSFGALPADHPAILELLEGRAVRTKTFCRARILRYVLDAAGVAPDLREKYARRDSS